jgi:hypothetical protein
VTPLSDKELIQNVILAAKNALLHSDDFKDNFVSNEFKQSNNHNMDENCNRTCKVTRVVQERHGDSKMKNGNKERTKWKGRIDIL